MAGEEAGDAHSDGQPRKPEEDQELLERLLSDREDWALERETEIIRLERENEELRKLLGTDQANAKARGWFEDEARELALAKYVPIASQPRDLSPGASQVDLRPGPSSMTFVNITTGGPPPAQRAADQIPGMRITQGRRSAMFGQRGRGGTPGFWDGAPHQPPTQERPWQAPMGLDLS